MEIMTSPVIEGRYVVIKEEHDRGGMGIVSKVYDMESDTLMAVKKTDKQYTNFKQESLAWVRLEGHPNIATFYYCRKNHEGKPLLYYRFVDGHNLKIWARKNSIRSQIKREKDKETMVLQVISMALQIASAMCSAHKQSIFHLDLRLENILIDERKPGFPLVILIDFGIYVKDIRDEQELLKIIDSDYFQEYRKNRILYGWPSNKDIEIRHFFECDVQSFVNAINKVISELGFSKGEFVDILKLMDKDNILYKNENLTAIFNNNSLGLSDIRFCQIHDDLSLILNHINGYTIKIHTEDKLDKEATLINQAISLLYIDGSKGAIDEAKKKLENALDLNIPNSNHLYSNYNYKLLQFNHYGISWRSLVHFKKKKKPKEGKNLDHPEVLDFFLTCIYQAQICIALGYPNSAWKFIEDAKNFEKMDMYIWGVDHFIRSKYHDLYGLLYLFAFNFDEAKTYFQTAIKLVDNYWVYKMHLAVSIVKHDMARGKKSAIENLLKEIIEYGNTELIYMIKSAYEIKEITPKILLRYISDLNLNPKYLASIKSPLLPPLNYIFDMSSEYLTIE